MELQVSSADEERARQILEKQQNRPEIKNILIGEGSILEGHFLLTSGRHSGTYVEKIRLLQNPQATERVCEMLAELLEPFEFDTVAGPAYGGIVLAFEVAKLLGKSFIFTQRKNEEMTIRSGFDLSEVKNVVVIEDIVTTGGSVKEVISCLKSRGIAIQAVAAIVDRSGGQADFGCPFLSLLQLDIPTWDAASCPLCLEGIALTKPGASDKKI
ncbi:MAG: orotate phosphoribosyltransferase [Candidatus Syntrophosphaera sp.]|nr:orotate phosphoribosyltransferase [Candidatus Syntrophosphaera sp.]